LSTMAFAYSTANDALYDVLNDIVLSTHGAMAMAMVAYISINFLQPLLDGLPAYKVFYKPNAVQFSMTWIFGFMLAGGMQFENGFAMYRQGFAAYYTLLGDADWAKDDVYSAKQYYGIARTYTPLSHRIHYTLGSLARKEQLKQDAYIFFKDAQAKRPSPHAYANMAALNEKQGFSFDALFDLRRGLGKFPQSGELLNNMGLMMNQTQLADSAFIYFQLARERGNRPEVAEANLFSLWTKYSFSQSPDGLSF
jgi:tetratricopeptide (TPR) repeat protein